MVRVELIRDGSVPPHLSYVVIATRHKGEWLFVRHRIRGGWEMPAGHPEEGEESIVAAARELTEETGAAEFTLIPVSYYFVESGNERFYGRLFLAEVESLGRLTDSDEIVRTGLFGDLPEQLSLPEVMSFLFGVARDFLQGRE